jgi:hypothetical protein
MVLSRRFEPPDLVEVVLVGIITGNDQRELVTFARAAIRTAGTVRVLVRLVGFGGWQPGETGNRDAVWLRDDEGVARMAIVGDPGWKTLVLTMLAQPVRQIPISYFDNEEDARTWLQTPQRVPHIQSAGL